MVLDGAMGSLIYAHEPTEEDYRGARFASHPFDLKNCTEVLVLTQPKLIEEIHRAYLEAGADIIETDTFNGNRALAGRVRPRGARRRAEPGRRRDRPPRRRRLSPGATPDKPRFVAGSIGPTKKQLSMGIHVEDPGRRDVTFDEMVANYTEQIRGPGRGRRRHPPARDLVRHPGDEGVPVRHRRSSSRRPARACR